MENADALSHLFGLVQLRAVQHGCFTIRQPLGYSVPGDDGAAFYIALSGTLRLGVSGHDWVSLQPGDFAVIAKPTEHALADEPHRQLIPWPPTDSATDAELDQSCRLVAGRFLFDVVTAAELQRVLPRLMLVRGAGGVSKPELFDILRIVGRELNEARPGSEIMIQRASEMLVIEAIRHCIAQREHLPGSWLRALGDPRLRRAIDAVAGAPAEAWTVQGLASVAGMSRSRFHEHFSTIVGESPMQHVTRWRMQEAQRMLRNPELSLSVAAGAVGYGSEEAFSKAFRRHTGQPPGTWRRQVAMHESRGR